MPEPRSTLDLFTEWDAGRQREARATTPQPARQEEAPRSILTRAEGVTGTAQPASYRVRIPTLKEGGQLAYHNNNPGNLRFAKQRGAEPGQGGFARFETPEAGFGALVRQVKLDTGRGHTLRSFIGKYAPPTENDTGSYIKTISKYLNTHPDEALSRLEARKVAEGIARIESQTQVLGR